MLLEGFSASVSQWAAELCDAAGPLLIALVSTVDPEVASAWAGVLARSLAADSPGMLVAAAATGAFVRSWLLYEAAFRGVLSLERDGKLAWKKLESRLLRAPLLMTAGLQFCFAARWAAPILAARIGLSRTRFCTAALIGITLWCAVAAAAACGITYWCSPGLLGLQKASASIAGQLLAALIAATVLKAVLQRLFERLRRKNDDL